MVHARDQIGEGPWYNANGQIIAANVADLHGDFQRDRNNIRKPTAVDENGELVNGVGDQPNQHDILTARIHTGVRSLALQTPPRVTTGRATRQAGRWSDITTVSVEGTPLGMRCT